MPPPVDLFLAHATADRASAEQLFDLLRPDIEAWLATRCILPGDVWPKEIQRAQRSAMATVILVSSRAEEAFYLEDEIQTALARFRAVPEEHRVIPVFLEGIPTGAGWVPLGLRSIQGLDAVVEGGLVGIAGKLRALVVALRARRGTSSPTVTAPVPVVPVVDPREGQLLYEMLCKLIIGAQLEAVIFRAGLPRHQLAPPGASIAQRALDVSQYAVQGGPPLIAAVKAAIAKEAPWMAGA